MHLYQYTQKIEHCSNKFDFLPLFCLEGLVPNSVLSGSRGRPRPFILVIVSASKPALQACEKRRRFSSYSVFFFVQMCNARAANNPSDGSTCPMRTRLSCSACCTSDHVCHKQQPKKPASESTPVTGEDKAPLSCLRAPHSQPPNHSQRGRAQWWPPVKFAPGFAPSPSVPGYL